MVLHIPISEAKVFTTKERAPYLICIEVFRPYEELLELDREPELKRRILRANSLNYNEQRFTDELNGPISVNSDGVTDLLKSFANNRGSDDGVMKMQSRFSSFTGNPSQLHYDGVFMNIDPRATTIGVVYGNKEEEDEETDENMIQNNTAFKENFKDQAKRIRSRSPFGKLKTWDMVRVIVKSGDDLRQEQLAMQLISFFLQIFQNKKLDI